MALRKKKFLVSASGEEICAGLVRTEAYLRDPDLSLDDVDDDGGLHAHEADDTAPIELIQTHMSMVFLRRDVVYKVKKNVDFGFADFSSVFKRMQACLAEVQLNQRLAPTVYLGVVPIYKGKDGVLRVSTYDYWTDAREKDALYYANDDVGEVVDWAVKMRRLPNANNCLHLLRTGALSPAVLTAVARKIAAFHVAARKSPSIDVFGSPATIKGNVDENFDQTKTHARAGLVDAHVYDQVRALSEQWTDALTKTFVARVENKYISDTHGDLRLEHVYLLPSSANAPLPTARAAVHYVPPISAYALSSPLDLSTLDVVVLDCIEFNERFRFADPLSDTAFLAMDLLRLGRPDLASCLNRAYLDASKQTSKANTQLLQYYTAYRSVVRAKVSGFQALDPLMHDEARSRARAQCHWLVAYSLLAPPAHRPCLVLVSGLPACGKSAVAGALTHDDPRWLWVRSDVVRKTLAHLDPEAATPPEALDRLYAPGFTHETYAACWAEAEAGLRRGLRVVVDATFAAPAQRTRFVEGGKALGVAVAVVACVCNREIVKGRMAKRALEPTHVSDATWAVFEQVEKAWTPWAPADGLYSLVPDDVFEVNTEQQLPVSVQRVRGFLRTHLGVE